MILRLPRDTVLVLIDFQKAIDHPKWGARNNPDAEAKAARLLALWRDIGLPIVHIRHDSVEPQSPYRPGQPDHDFKPVLCPADGETVIAKSTTSAFIGTTLETELEAIGATTLVVCGVLTQNSVEATVRHAGDLGFRVIVVTDATAASEALDGKGRIWPAEEVHWLSLGNLKREYADLATEAVVAAAISRWRR